MKKTLILLIVVIICILVLFILFYRNIDKDVFSSNEDERKVVAEIPEENIKLYAINKDDGMYTQFILQLGDMQRYFHWKNTTNPTFSPKLVLSDLNKDGVEELIVILTIGTGTGVHTEEIHIIDTATFEDYDAENPVHYIYKNVKTKLSPEEVEISFDDETIILDERYIDVEPQQLFKDIVFEDIIHYEIKDNKLYALVGAKIAPSSYIGDIELSYYFQGKMYIVENIKFIPIEPKNDIVITD